MKYIIIPYIALGLLFSLVIGIEYSCVGDGAYPKFYGSPFVFKQKSLVSSMEYYYSMSGLLLNTIVWSMPLALLRLLILRILLKTSQNSIIKAAYNIGVLLLLAFSTLNIVIESVVIGNGFSEGSNYWHFDLDKKAAEWRMECEHSLVFLKR